MSTNKLNEASTETKCVEEMVRTMLEASQNANVEPVLEIDGKEVVLGENATKLLDNILEQAYIPFLAEKLTEAGYRKASDVAREIFEEIECTARGAIVLLKFEKNEQIRTIKTECYQDLVGYVAELKKKYAESEDTE